MSKTMSLPAEISFIVSQNDKGDNPKRPDWRGEVKIGAATYELAAWKRTKQGSDRQFVSGKLTLKEPKADQTSESPYQRPQHEPERRSSPPANTNLDEDVPF